MSDVISHVATEQDERETIAAREERNRSQPTQSTSRVVDGGANTENGTDNSGGVRRVTAGVSDLADSLPVSDFMTKGNQVVPLSKVDGDTLCTLPNGMQCEVSFAIENGFLPPEFLDNPLKVAGELAAARKAEQEKEANRRVDLNDANDIQERLVSIDAAGFADQVDGVLSQYIEHGDTSPDDFDAEGIAKALKLTTAGAEQAFEQVIQSKSAAVDSAIAHLVNDREAFYRWCREPERAGRFSNAFRSVAFNTNDHGGFVDLAREYAGMHAGADFAPDAIMTAYTEGKLPNVVGAVQDRDGTVFLAFADGSRMDHRSAVKAGLIKMGAGR